MRLFRAFSLLELVVVLVVLALLAAIAIPTFSEVIDKTYDHSAGTTLNALGKDSAALSRMDSSPFSLGVLETAVSELPSASAAGVSAAGTSWRLVGTPTERGMVTDDPSTALSIPPGDEEQVGLVAFGFEDGFEGMGLATRSRSGRCIVSAVSVSGSTSWRASAERWGECLASAAFDDVVAAPSASAILLSAVPENTAAVLSWTPVPGADSYTVYTEVDGETSSTPGALTPERFVVPGLSMSSGKLYTFRVTALDDGRESRPSNDALLSATMAAPVLSTSWSNVSGTVGDPGQLTVRWSWTPVYGAAGYHLQHWDGDSWELAVGRYNLPASQTSFSYTNLGSPTKWRFRVVPKHGSSISAYSEKFASNAVDANAAPLGPSRNLTDAWLAPDGRSVNVSHGIHADADAYVLWYRERGTPVWSRTSPHTGTSASFPTNPHTTYDFSVGSVFRGVVGNMQVPHGIFTVPAPTITASAWSSHQDLSGNVWWSSKVRITPPAGAMYEIDYYVECSADAVPRNSDDTPCHSGFFHYGDDGSVTTTARSTRPELDYVYVRAIAGANYSHPSNLVKLR